MDNLVIRPWRRMFDFRSRATRREFWLLQLQIVPLLLFNRYATAFAGRNHDSAAAGLILALLGLVLMLLCAIACFSASVRRLHDQDKRGWLVVLMFVPLVGPLALLALMLLPGTAGVNGYGYDPRDGDLTSSGRMVRVFS